MSQTQTVKVPETKRVSIGIPKTITLVQGDKVQPLIDTSKFSKEQLAWAKQQAEALDWSDRNSVTRFAAEPQEQLNAFLDTLLRDVTARDAGPLKEIVIAMAKGIKSSGLDDFQKMTTNMNEGSKLQKFINMIWDEAKKFLGNYQKLDKLMDEIVARLKKQEEQLKEENVKMDLHYKKNAEFQDEYALWIISGDMALQIGKDKFAKLKEQSDKSGDARDAEATRDFQDQVTRFEVRLLNMKLAYYKSMLNGPDIRMAQDATQIEMDNIENMLLSGMADFRRAILKAVTIYNIMSVQGDRKLKEEMIRALEEANARGTRQAILTAKRSQGEGLLMEVNHVSNMAKIFLQTMEQVQVIEKQNTDKREEATKRLSESKQEFTDGLKKLSS